MRRAGISLPAWGVFLAALIPAALSGQSVAVETIAPKDLETFLRACPSEMDDRWRTLYGFFEDVGCGDGNLLTQKVKGAREPNLIALLPGETKSTILVGAHHDYSSEGLMWFIPGGKGVIDNWSGAVMLPALYAALSRHPRKHTFVFVAFAAEERGMVGSKHYAKNMSPDERANSRAMINLECLGLDSTAVWVKRSDKALWEAMLRASSVTKLPVRGVDMQGVAGSDASPFLKLKIPVLEIHSFNQDKVNRLHTFLDDLFSVNWKEYYDSYALIATFLAYLDVKLGRS